MLKSVPCCVRVEQDAFHHGIERYRISAHTITSSEYPSAAFCTAQQHTHRATLVATEFFIRFWSATSMEFRGYEELQNFRIEFT